VSQNGKVHEESTIADVIEVVFDVLVDGECAVGAQLPEAGDAGNRLKSLPLLCAVSLDNKGHLRPWPDERHRSHQYIQQLRQLIHIRFAEKPPNPGNSRIV